MEEDYLHIAKTNIRPEPYYLLRKVFHEKGYEATTRVLIYALVTRITQHNMLQFSMKKPYKLHQEQRQTEKNGIYYQRYKRPHRCGGGGTSQISDQGINNVVHGTTDRHPTGD